DAVLVPDAVADGRDVHGGERVDEAGGQTTEAAVAEARLDLGGADLVEVEAERGERVAGDLGETGGEERVGQLRAHEVLGGQVGDGLRALRGLRGQCVEPVVDHVAADGAGERLVQVVAAGEAKI